MQYVRKKPKGFGRDAQIEGVIEEGQRVLLVEDLTTDGGSKLKFAQAIREAGAECKHTLVVFYYDIFEGSTERLAENGLAIHYLANWRHVLTEARAGGHFDKKTLDAVGEFLADPIGWSAAQGG